MPDRRDTVRSLARHVRRWLPGPGGIAGAAAAVAAPARLLGLTHRDPRA